MKLLSSLMNHSKIPKQNLKTVQGCINQLKNLDAANTPLDEIKDILNKAFTGHISTLCRLPLELCCYRAINYSEKPTAVSFLSYPPAAITKAGRANRDNVPMFYAASHPIAALREVYPKAGDKLVISKWQVKKTFQCQIMYDFFDVKEFNGNIKATNELNGFIREYFSLTSRQSQKFSYNVTIAITENLLSGDMIGGLVYPPANNLSKNAGLRFDNYVFKPSIVDDCMELVAVNYIVITESPESSDTRFDFEILDYGTPSNGAIQWHSNYIPISDTFIKK